MCPVSVLNSSHLCARPQMHHAAAQGRWSRALAPPKKAQHLSGAPGTWLQTLEPPTGRLSLPLQHNVPQLSLLCGFLPRSVPPSLYLTSSHGSLPPLKAAQPCQDTSFHQPWDSSPPSLFSEDPRGAGHLPKAPSTFPRQIRWAWGDGDGATGVMEVPRHHPAPALGGRRVLEPGWDSRQ